MRSVLISQLCLNGLGAEVGAAFYKSPQWSDIDRQQVKSSFPKTRNYSGVVWQHRGTFTFPARGVSR